MHEEKLWTDVLARLARIEKKLDSFADHRHDEYLTWPQLAGVLIPLIGLVLVLS
jgi:hypothetical protein